MNKTHQLGKYEIKEAKYSHHIQLTKIYLFVNKNLIVCISLRDRTVGFSSITSAFELFALREVALQKVFYAPLGFE